MTHASIFSGIGGPEVAGMLAERERLMKEAPVPADVQEAADKAAEKAAYKHYPNSPSYGQFGTGDYQPEEDNSLDREVFVKGFKAGIDYERERLASCPAINGWVARDSSPVNAQDLNIGKLKIWPKVPYRNKVGLFWMPNFPQDFAIMMLPSDLFPDLRWEDEPIEVEIIVKTKQ